MESKVNVICAVCEISFVALRKDILRGHAKYCGRTCFGDALSIARGGDPSRSSIRNCEVCQEVFSCKRSRDNKYCSRQCSGVAKRGVSRIGLPNITINPDNQTASVPLFGKDATIRAYATIDKEDIDTISKYRWHMDSDGYARTDQTTDQGRYRHLMHRDILGLTRTDKLTGDHIDRNRLNNTRSNLRIIRAQDQQDNTSGQINASSRYRGVSWAKHANKWKAVVTKNKKTLHIGYFSNEEEAAFAASEARKKLMPYATD